jgi:hypothetical protein
MIGPLFYFINAADYSKFQTLKDDCIGIPFSLHWDISKKRVHFSL